jgi:hypothetical protein
MGPRPGLEKGQYLAHTGIRTTSPPARSEQLDRLRYPGYRIVSTVLKEYTLVAVIFFSGSVRLKKVKGHLWV